MKKRTCLALIAAMVLLSLEGCAPKVGSEKWCAKLQEKPKGNWTLDETKNYARYCIIR